MNPLDETEHNAIKFNNKEIEQNNLFFPKHYLLLEVEKLKISIKHFFETRILSKEDYEYIGITLKMMKRFLTIHVQCPKNPKPEKLQKYTVTAQPSLFDLQDPSDSGEVIVSGLN